MTTRNAHSEKALKTIEALGTRPEQWKHADVEYTWGKIKVIGKVKCPTCKGQKKVIYDAAGNVVEVRPNSRDYPGDGYAWNEALRAFDSKKREINGHTYPAATWCRTCAARRGPSTGEVPGVVEVDGWIGRVIWPEGTRFDSRFNTGRFCCELCSKSLSWVRVPVVGVGDDGRIHGMRVGEDCARKFLPGTTTYVKPNRTPDGKAKAEVEFVDDVKPGAL